jgi:hypothetical protein
MNVSGQAKHGVSLDEGTRPRLVSSTVVGIHQHRHLLRFVYLMFLRSLLKDPFRFESPRICLWPYFSYGEAEFMETMKDFLSVKLTTA